MVSKILDQQMEDGMIARRGFLKASGIATVGAMTAASNAEIMLMPGNTYFQ
jgi:hypothetical protein